MKSCIKTNKLLILLFFATTFLGPSFLEAKEPASASISFRIGHNIWSDDAHFNQLLELFDKYPNATDEFTFFTQGTHAPITDEELERRCLHLKKRIAETHAHGYRAGINILCTIGQHPEDLPHSIGPEFPRAQTIDGTIAQATLCPNNDMFRKRIRRIYKAIADAGPDYIWIDDDVRTGHMLDSSGTPGSLCYCDNCMKILAQKFDKEITREYLKENFDAPETLAKIREFTSDSYNLLFSLIEETVHQVNPDLPIGFMTGERYDEGYDFARWAKTLADPNGDREVYWRPGGGFYDQSSMSALFGKSHEIGRQVSLLPPEITVIQSEIENFPYQLLMKSANVTTLEAVSHIAVGCTGAAFNVLTGNNEPLDEYEDMVATIAERRPFFDLAVQKLGRKPNIGVFPLWEKEDGNFPNRTPVQALTSCFSEIGIPIAYTFHEDTNVVLLSRAYLSHKTPEEAKNIFQRGVYTDLDAVNLANDPATYKLNDLTGMEYGGEIRVDGIEKIEEHPLNGAFANRTRDLRQSFWREPIYSLRKTRPNVETLSSCIDYGGNQTAETIVGIYENSLGGRICINGYYPWSNFYSYSKQSQIRAIIRWLSKDRLPGYVDSFAKINFWLREPGPDGSFAGIAINSNYDAVREVAIMLKTDSDFIDVYDYNCQKTTISSSYSDKDGYRRFIISEIKPWEPVLIVCK